MALLEIRDLSSGYGEVQILWGAEISLEEGQLTSLIGANGAGKTTMLRTVMGLLKPWQGSVWFQGEDVSNLSPHEKAERGLILVPEGRQLFNDMTVEENLEMGASPMRARGEIDNNYKTVYRLFPRLEERAKQKAGTLSGGEQQMLAVGRGIMANPIVLMLDELSLGLAPVLVIEIFENLIELKKSGLTMLLVEQNVQMALAVSDFGYVLNQGRVEIEGSSKKLLKNKKIKESYLGI